MLHIAGNRRSRWIFPNGQRRQRLRNSDGEEDYLMSPLLPSAVWLSIATSVQIHSPMQPTQGQPLSIQEERLDAFGDPLPRGAVARLGTRRFRHGNYVYAMSLSPDGTMLASVGGHRVVHIWDALRGKEIRSFDPGMWTMRSVCFSSDGQMLATASQGEIAFWRLNVDLPYRTLPAAPWRMTFSPDGKLLAAGALQGGLSLWDVPTGKERAVLQNGRRGKPDAAQAVRAVAFSPDGRLLASAQGSDIRLWNSASYAEVCHLTGHSAPVSALAFSPTTKLLASGSVDKSVRLWDVDSRKETRRMDGHSEAIESVAFAPDGKMLASGSGNPSQGEWPKDVSCLRLWDTDVGKEIAKVGAHPQGVVSVAFSPDGKRLYAGGGCSLRVFDTTTRAEIGPVGGHEHWVSSLAYSPDGATLASAGGDRTIRLWDTITNREKRNLRGCQGAIDSVVFPPDGTLLASGSREGTIRIWNAAEEKKPLSIAGHTREVVVAFSPSGRQLASAGRDGNVYLWDVVAGKKVRQFEGRRKEFLCLAFSPDGKMLAAGGLDERKETKECPVLIWDTETGVIKHELPRQVFGTHAVAFSPDGKLLATVSWDGALRLWEPATSKELHLLAGSGAYRAVFSPDGKAIVSTGFDGAVHLWEVATGLERCRFDGDGGGVVAAAFAPDGHTLCTGGMDTAILVWDTRAPQPARADLTEQELNAIWTVLAQSNAAEAYRAMWRLIGSPRQAIPCLRARLRSGSVPPEQLVQLLADLADDRFSVREKATAELASLGELAEPSLRALLRGQPSPEARRRADLILARLGHPISSPVTLRRLRTIEILEHTGTLQARQILNELANDAREPALSQEAKASLARLEHGERTTRRERR
jgi:WD40 repeat protein